MFIAKPKHKNYTTTFISKEFNHYSEKDSKSHVWLPMDKCIKMIFTEHIRDSLSIIVLLAYLTKINTSYI